MPKGRPPKNTCPKVLHFIATPQEKRILDRMGPGSTLAKLHYLVNEYGSRLLPRNEIEIKAQILDHKKALKEHSAEIALLTDQLKNLGKNPEEIDQINEKINKIVNPEYYGEEIKQEGGL